MAVLSFAVFILGCQDRATASTTDRPAAAVQPDRPVGPAAQPAPSGDIAEQSMVVMEKMADLFAINRANCDKLGTELVAFIRTNASVFNKMKEHHAKLSPEAQQATAAKYKARNEAAMAKMEPVITTCKSNAAVLEAMQALPL